MVRRVIATLALLALTTVAGNATGEGIVQNLNAKVASLRVGHSTFEVEVVLGPPGSIAGRRGNVAYLYCEELAQDTLYATVFFVDGAFHSAVVERRGEVIRPCVRGFGRVDWDALPTD
ncbi:MAG: hypothetical protein KIS96_10625 [Bauldia sp.]|nr:hypothetical protein [Bauldia sp.]